MNLKVLTILTITGIVTMRMPVFSSDKQVEGSASSELKIDITKGKPQTTCPVLGGEIDKSLYVDFQGKRIYVCCEECIGVVKKDPERHIRKLEAKGIVLEKTPEGSKEGTTEKREYKEHSWANEKCFPKNEN